METAADLGTRGGRVQHVRFALATRHGNVGLEKFGVLVAEEETRLTGESVAAYAASTVLRWEAGAALYLNTALAIASLGSTTAEWIGLGAGVHIKREPTEAQQKRTKVVKPNRSERPRQNKRKRS